MNKLPLLLCSTAGALLFTAAASVAQEEKLVAFRATNGEYVGTYPQGALRTNGKVLAAKHIFTLIDVNGGELEDGDEVKLKEVGASNKASFWLENGDNLTRTQKEEPACVFKIKRNDKTVKLQTASGKFVAVNNRAMALADETDKSTVFEMIENPVADPSTATPAASASPTPTPTPKPSPTPAKRSWTL